MSTPTTPALITSAINAQLASATDITALTLRGVMDQLNVSATAGSITPMSVKQFGAKGDGVTDDTSAIDSAMNALAVAGGGTMFFPPGNYLMANDVLIPPSNSVIQGAGMDITTITNTCTAGGKDCVLAVVMTMSGTSGGLGGLWTSTNTTYAINTPTLGANTVTTTTPADAGNFAAGNIIMVSGPTHGTAFWYPSWYTTVVSVNAGTGVITLAETLPLGGSQLTLVQKIVSLPKNITVRDMTLTVNSNIGGVTGQILEVLGCDTFLIENVKFVNAQPSVPGAGVAIGAPVKHSGFRNCHAYQGAGPIELFGASQSFIEGCTLIQNSLLIDGGSFDCTLINNHIKDPQENASAFHAIHCPDYNARIKIIGNSITGLSGTFAGINCTGVPDVLRNHVIAGNTVVGSGSGNTNGVNAFNGSVVGNVFSNLLNGISVNAASTAIIEGNFYDSVTNPLVASSEPAFYTTRQSPNAQQTLAGNATPTIGGGSVYLINQSGAQNITGLNGGNAGDEVTLILGDANTTFVNSGHFFLKGGINYNPIANTVVTFVCFSSGTPGIWFEKSRSQ